MPTTAARATSVDPVQATLMQVAAIKHHAAFNMAITDPEQKQLVEEMRHELRTLEVKLSLGEGSEKDRVKWCSDKRTSDRLKNMATSLNTIDSLNDKHVNSTIKQHEAIEKHCIRHLRDGVTYRKGFRHFLGQDALIKNMLDRQAIIDDLNEVKEIGGDLAKVASKTKRVVDLATQSTHIVHGGVEGTGSLLHSLHGLMTAVPFVMAGLTAASAITNVIKSFLRKEGASEKAVAITVAGVGIAAAALMIAFPVAAFGIAAGMVAVGTYMDHIKPYLETRKKIKQRTQDISDLDARIGELEKNDTTPLNSREKKVLIDKIIDHGINNPNISMADLHAAKAFIQADGINLSSFQSDNPAIAVIKDSTGLTKDQPIKDFLIQNSQDHKSEIQTEIKGLQEKNKSTLALAVNGGFATAGAIMLAAGIVFPPVMMAGAALILATTVVGILIKYKEPIKRAWNNFKNGVKKLFGTDKKNDDYIELKETNDPSLSHKNSAKSNSNFTHVVERKKDHCASFTSSETAQPDEPANTNEEHHSRRP